MLKDGPWDGFCWFCFSSTFEVGGWSDSGFLVFTVASYTSNLPQKILEITARPLQNPDQGALSFKWEFQKQFRAHWPTCWRAAKPPSSRANFLKCHSTRFSALSLSSFFRSPSATLIFARPSTKFGWMD